MPGVSSPQFLLLALWRTLHLSWRWVWSLVLELGHFSRVLAEPQLSVHSHHLWDCLSEISLRGATSGGSCSVFTFDGCRTVNGWPNKMLHLMLTVNKKQQHWRWKAWFNLAGWTAEAALCPEHWAKRKCSKNYITALFQNQCHCFGCFFVLFFSKLLSSQMHRSQTHPFIKSFCNTFFFRICSLSDM